MGKILITNGTVLAMEPGDAPRRADVLVEDDRIVEIASKISADADVIDATDCLVTPGFVDTHRHVWQTSLKSLVPNETLKDYFRSVRFQGSLVYRPDDTYISTLAGSLEALDAGVTTMLDFNNNVSSAETADASIRGLRDSGIRAQFALGMNDTFGQDESLAAPGGRAALLRSVRSAMSSDDARVALSVALSDLPEVGAARIRSELTLARELGLRSTTNSLAILFTDPVDDIAVFEAEGLIGPDLLWVHNLYATDEQLRRVTDLGTHTASCPEAELNLGMGRPATHRVLAAGGHCSFGCDTVSSVSGDLLMQARVAMLVARQLDNDEAMQQGRAPEALAPSAETMLRGLTLWGAEALGLDSRIGSLTPGKQADLLVIRGDSPRLAPLGDPYGSIVLHASAADIDTVLVAGRPAKRGGVLTADWPSARRALQVSHDGLADRIEGVGGWFPKPAIPLPW